MCVCAQVDLGTEYVDLLLLHYPSCWGDLCKPIAGDPSTHTDNTDTDSSAPRTWRETWRAFETLYAEKRVRAIGEFMCGVCVCVCVCV